MKQSQHVFNISKAALQVCKTVNASGERIYVVGGALRDMLMGRTGGDIDFTTTASPKKIMELFDKVVPTGIKHGTVTVLVGKQSFEVTTLRGERGYSDGRRPDSVEFIDDIEKDLERRDFTVNAIAWDPIGDIIKDPFGGMNDLSADILRAVGDPIARFKEDGLRLLRAARFAATHGFEIEENTACAIPITSEMLGKVSSERKRDEIVKILLCSKPSKGLRVMEEGGLLPYVSQDLFALASGVSLKEEMQRSWRATLDRIDEAQGDLWVRIACLFLNASKQYSDSALACESWLKAIHFDRKTISAVPHLIRSCSFENFDDWSDTDVRRFVKRLGKEHVSSVMEIVRADAVALKKPESHWLSLSSLKKRVNHVINNNEPLYPQDLAVSGKDLMDELGLTPGPQIGAIIDILVENVIEHPENNKKDVLLSEAKARSVVISK